MEKQIVFLPVPRHITWHEGSFTFAHEGSILLDPRAPQDLRFTGTKFRDTAQQQLGIKWKLVASWAVPTADIALTLLVMPEAVPQPEGYWLRITPQEITIHGHDAAGVFYGVCTLLQLIKQAQDATVPCVEIKDWPDFPARGVMLDISRDKVPTMETLYALVDRLASWKINQVQLYTEHTFAYRQHPDVWAHASPMTGEEILALDAYCRERFVELVPNQNSFGHMARWLRHPRYAPLAETHEEFETPWGNTMKGPFSLAPQNPGSITLIRSLYDELLPHFTSQQINVGCDETIDLGKGVSQAICEERGVGQVYLDFLMKIYQDISRRGYTMQFWGDIILHHPELVPALPRDLIALEWGYEFDHPFDEHGAQFAAAGVPFYVCPGTSSWNSIAGRTDNALGNLLSAAESGCKHGAIGYLNTDWGDNGHWQYLPMSYLGFGMGAAYAWCLAANRNLEPAQAISYFAFNDLSGRMGNIAYNLGNLYQMPNLSRIHNSDIFFRILQGYSQVPEQINEAALAEDFEDTLTRIDEILAPLPDINMDCPDAELVKREFANAGHLIRQACRRALHLIKQREDERSLLEDLEAAIQEHKALWLARNRPGGLNDSLAHFDNLRIAYQKQ